MEPAQFQERLEDADIESRCKTQQPTAPGGLFTKDRFDVNLDDDTVTCPAGVTSQDPPHGDGGRHGLLRTLVHQLPAARQVHHLDQLGAPSASAPTKLRSPEPAGVRPTRTGKTTTGHASEGRTQARPPHAPTPRRTTSSVRGTVKVDADFSLLAAATNLARLAVLGTQTNLSGQWAAG